MTSQPFFIVGCPRSGTTLLSVLLDRHSRLAVTPETAFFQDLAPLAGYCFHQRMLLELLKRWRRLPELHLEPAAVVGELAGNSRWVSAQTRRRQLLGAILSLYARAQGKLRCGEKTPRHLRHVPTLLDWFPDAKVLCLLRDGRAAALSLLAMPWFRGSLEAAAARWNHAVELQEEFAQAYPDRFQVVRYEQLLAEPESVLQNVMTFLGETYQPQQLCSEVSSQVVLERSLPWKGSALKELNPEATRSRLEQGSSQQLKRLEALLGDRLVRHGYVVREGAL